MMRHPGGSLAPLLLLLAWSTPAGAQPADPRSGFLDALGAFSLALDGARGDEGARLGEALDRMNRSLAEWDTLIAGYERAMGSELPAADAARAVRMRTAVGIVYAERGRVRDALDQFTMARTLDPAGAAAPMLQGLTYSQLLHDSDRAAEAFRQAASLAPQDPVAAYLLADALRQAGHDEEASEAIEALLRAIGGTAPAAAPGSGSGAPFVRLGLVPEVPGLEPFLPPVRYADGYAALRQGDLRLALDRFRDALAADPLAAAAATAPPRAPGAAAFRDGRLEEAREAFAAAVAQAPKDAEAHRLLGLVEAAGGRYAAAADALEKAVALDAGDERARLALADALARDGRAEAAAAVLEKTLADMPGSGRARYALGLLHRQEGRYLETLAELEQAVSHEPLLGRNSIYQTIAALRRSNLDLEGAIDAYAARAALTPNDAAAHQDLGEVHALLGEDAWAEAEFRVALLLDPARAAARTALAHVYLRDGRYEQAAEASREALAIDAGDREAHYVHATALVRLGKAEEGRQHLETYQRLLAEDAAARARGLELGRLRREAAVATARGDHAAAAALLEEALAYAPRAPESHLDLGLALLGAGRLPEAIERLSSAIALGAPPEAHLRLADAYDAAGRTDEGRRTRDAYASLKRDAIRRGEP